MSDKDEGPDTGGWVPSPEQPVPPTTEFGAIDPSAVESIDAAGPDETAPEGPEPISAPTTDPESVSVPAPEPDASLSGATAPTSAEGPVTPPATDPGPSAGQEPPAWKTPAAAGLPPQWGDPDAVADAAGTGPQPVNGIENIWGLAPEDRPEVALGAALAGGVLAAILVRTLAR